MTGAAATALRYYETIRRLKPEQIYGRVWFRLARPSIDLSPAPTLRDITGFAEPATRQRSLIDDGVFRFLNVDGALSDIGWDGPQRDKLWRYNQHYFDDLSAQSDAAQDARRQAMLEDWAARNPPGMGVGWEPYPLSLRIVNWIKWSLRGGRLSPALLHSLAVQARYLSGRLERHLLGNHLFANAKALLFAGHFFQGPEADRWAGGGFDILAKEFDEQILADGGQFELSPMYHALAVEDVLDLVNLTAACRPGFMPHHAQQAEHWRNRVPAMLSWLASMTHPDGEIAFFNDAAMGVAPAPSSLFAYAQRLGFAEWSRPEPLTRLAASGYARLARGDAVLFCDMAQVGPDYLPGHAHADTLSFELSVFGQRAIVNGGTSVYGTSAERLRQRGTAAHSTVVVAGANSSDVWSGFRVGARARITQAQAGQAADALYAEGAHDGYRSLSGRPLHRRRWRLSDADLVVEDEVTVPDLPAEALFHLHPDVSIMHLDGAGARLSLPDGHSLTAEAAGLAARPSSWHPAFGVTRESQVLTVPLRAGRARFRLAWAAT